MKIQCVECFCATLHASTTAELSIRHKRTWRNKSPKRYDVEFIFFPIFRCVSFNFQECNRYRRWTIRGIDLLLTRTRTILQRLVFVCAHWLLRLLLLLMLSLERISFVSPIVMHLQSPTTQVHHEHQHRHHRRPRRRRDRHTWLFNCANENSENNLVTDDNFRLWKMGLAVRLQCRTPAKMESDSNCFFLFRILRFYFSFYFSFVCSSSRD